MVKAEVPRSNDPIAVSVIVPCFNERGHIEPFLASIASQRDMPGPIEVLIADGMSDDGTRDYLERIRGTDATIHVIDNPRRAVSSGLNLALGAARGGVIVRMDVHTRYADDYVARCLEVLTETAADNVGGPWKAVGETPTERAIAAASHSPFATGGARSHQDTWEGEVDTVYLGCWRRDTLLDLGGFDEALVRNQDDELNLRLRLRGGRIWQARDIRSWYRPRGSLLALFRQYSQYGYWKVAVLRKHGQTGAIRHALPALAVVTALICASLAAWEPLFLMVLLVMLGTYAAANVGASIVTGYQVADFGAAVRLPAVFATFHAGYAYGFLWGMVDWLIGRLGSRRSFGVSTR